MSSFEFNKIAGAVLATALMVFGLKSLAGVIYHSERPEKPGYEIKIAEAEAPAAGTETPAQPAESLGTLLTAADPAEGKDIARSCAGCHDFAKGGPNKVGPELWGIVGRPRASHEGFEYSEAMAAKKGEPWSYENLLAFLKKPSAYVPGTKMSFGGIPKDRDRANLLAYLATLSDTKVPFPAP